MSVLVLGYFSYHATIYVCSSQRKDTNGATCIIRNADVNMKDNNGQTSLHHVLQENEKMYPYLQISELRVNKKDNQGQTALHCAKRSGNANIV